MRGIDTAAMRRIEQSVFASGTAPATLMRNAGVAAARRIDAMCRAKPALGADCPVAVVIGHGNNGGDGIVAAGELTRLGHPTTIFSSLPRAGLRGDGAAFARDLPSDVVFRETAALTARDLHPFAVVADAVFGIGFSGMPKAPLDSFLNAINTSGKWVVALDVPSGVDADTGTAVQPVLADRTLTFGFPKRGLFREQGDEASGVVEILPIGAEETTEPLPDGFDVLSRSEVASALSRIPVSSHKNTRGRILILCGSEQYRNAPVLAASGASVGGAGLIRVLTPCPPSAQVPAAWICRTAPFHAQTLRQNADFVAASDTILAGCGWGDSAELPDLLAALLRRKGKLVLDADALNCVARRPELWRSGEQRIITPHPGEARRLAEAFQVKLTDDRMAFAAALAKRLNCVVLLKGHHSVIAAPDGRCAVNPNGTPALATAGSGDVLAGLTAALFSADGRDAFAAAQLAAWLHGAAVDCTAIRPFSADELPGRIARVMEEVSPFA